MTDGHLRGSLPRTATARQIEVLAAFVATGGSVADAAAKVGVGAAGGAILGRILGGDAKSSALGAIAGAAAGTAIVLGTRDTYAVLPAGSVIELRTDAALRLDAES